MVNLIRCDTECHKLSISFNTSVNLTPLPRLVFTDLKRNTSLLQSATLEVEKALQEQNKKQHIFMRGTEGALQQKAPSRGMELSATLPRLTHPVSTPKSQPVTQKPVTQPTLQRPNKPSIVTIEDQGVVSEHMELSPAEVNSFIDQFERFLESEGLESEMEGSEKGRQMAAVAARAQQQQQQRLAGGEKMPSAAEQKSATKPVTIQVGGKSGAATVGGTGPVEAHPGVKKIVVRGSSAPQAIPVGSGVSVIGGSVMSTPKSPGSASGNLTWQETYSQSLQQQQQKKQVAQVSFVCKQDYNNYTLVGYSQHSSRPTGTRGTFKPCRPALKDHEIAIKCQYFPLMHISIQIILAGTQFWPAITLYCMYFSVCHFKVVIACNYHA